MKKILSILLTMALLLGCVSGFTGCGDQQNSDSTTVSTTEATDTTDTTEVTDATEATEPPTEATDATEATEPPTEATEPPTEATEPPTEATEPPTEATEPPTEATEPPTEATEPPTEATEPPTEATQPPTQATEPLPPATLEDAINYLKEAYKTVSSTPEDYDRYGILVLGDTLFNIKWTTSASADVLTIRVNSDKTVTVDINEEFINGTNYALTATVYDESGNSASHTWSHTIPRKHSGLKTEGKVCATFGDSITDYDGDVYNWGKEQGKVAYGYQRYMQSELRFSQVINYGYSGAPMPYIVEEVMKKITDAATWQSLDYITIMSGANDERWGLSVGALRPKGSNFDTTTYIGALQSGIEYALSMNPDLQIVLLTPIHGWIYAPKGYTADNPQTEDGIVTEKWANAVKEVAALYGLPVCDLYNNCGIGGEIADREAYMNDPEPPENEYYSLHPNTAGYKLIGQEIVRVFKEFSAIQ